MQVELKPIHWAPGMADCNNCRVRLKEGYVRIKISKIIGINELCVSCAKILQEKLNSELENANNNNQR